MPALRLPTDALTWLSSANFFMPFSLHLSGTTANLACFPSEDTLKLNSFSLDSDPSYHLDVGHDMSLKLSFEWNPHIKPVPSMPDPCSE